MKRTIGSHVSFLQRNTIYYIITKEYLFPHKKPHFINTVILRSNTETKTLVFRNYSKEAFVESIEKPLVPLVAMLIQLESPVVYFLIA